MNQSKLKTLSLLIGGLALIVAGLFYTLVTDLYLLNSAEWLFLAIFTALGSGFCAILSDSLRNHHKWFYAVKAIGLACGIAFIVIIFSYVAKVDIRAIVLAKRNVTTTKITSTVKFVETVCLIFGFIGCIAQVGNIALNVVYKIDD